MNKGFTLVELIVVIAVIAVLSAIILFSVTQYINKGKDSNIAAILVTLPPAGETYYNFENASHADGYTGFCDTSNSVIKNAILQLPISAASPCYSASASQTDSTNWTTGSEGNPKGLCCAVQSDGDAWVACMTEFTDKSKAYCVDSRGMKEEIEDTECTSLMNTSQYVKQCP